VLEWLIAFIRRRRYQPAVVIFTRGFPRDLFALRPSPATLRGLATSHRPPPFYRRRGKGQQERRKPKGD
jgi:hypothetical protein